MPAADTFTYCPTCAHLEHGPLLPCGAVLDGNLGACACTATSYPLPRPTFVEPAVVTLIPPADVVLRAGAAEIAAALIVNDDRLSIADFQGVADEVYAWINQP